MECRVITRDGRKVIVEEDGTLTDVSHATVNKENTVKESVKDYITKEGHQPWAMPLLVIVLTVLVTSVILG
jgi:maltodextrin utilization protein YvdJ